MATMAIGVEKGLFSRVRLVHELRSVDSDLWMIIIERSRDKASFWLAFSIMDDGGLEEKTVIEAKQYIESKMVNAFGSLESIQFREPQDAVARSIGMFEHKLTVVTPVREDHAWLDAMIRVELRKMAQVYGCEYVS